MLFKKIDGKSPDAMPSGLDLFSTPMTQVAIEKSEEREFILQNAIHSHPYIFIIHTGAQMMDPKSVRIVTRWKLKVKKSSDSAFRNIKIADTDANKIELISVVNGFGSNWMKNVNIKFSGQTVFDSNNYYAYKANFDNELGFSEDAKKSSMNSFGYYYDPRGKTDQAKRSPYTKRRDLFSRKTGTGEVIVEFAAPIYADIFQQPNYILSNLDIQIDIMPYHKEFLIVAPSFEGEIDLSLDFVRIYANFIDLHPGVNLEIEKRLAVEPAIYALRRCEMKTIFYAAGKTEAHSVLFSDFIPRQVVMVFIPNADYNGTFTTDPFNFIHSSIRYIQIKAGNMNVPSVQWELDFEKGHYIRAYDFFHRTVGLSGNELDCGINREMYGDGYTIFVFNLTSNQEDDEGFNFVREGPTIAHIRWNKPVEDGGYCCMIMGVFDSLLKIDLSRTVFSDLQA